MDFHAVCRVFGLGELREEPVEVAGGLSNRMWRVVAGGGVFAVKRMVLNAERPGFVDAVEAAFAVEWRAWEAGIPMPEPVPCAGRALARIPARRAESAATAGRAAPAEGTAEGRAGVGAGPAEGAAEGQARVGAGRVRSAEGAGRATEGSAGSAEVAGVGGSLVRVHRWVDGEPGGNTAVEAVRLAARIHAVGRPRWAGAPEPAWTGRGWPKDVRELARRIGEPPPKLLVVDSHRDLDPKNALRRADGTLVALDWDAAGAVAAVHEAVAVAVDWAGAEPERFREALDAYGPGVPRAPWIFGGWLAAQGGWLDHQAATAGGGGEVEGTLRRVREIEALVALG